MHFLNGDEEPQDLDDQEAKHDQPQDAANQERSRQDQAAQVPQDAANQERANQEPQDAANQERANQDQGNQEPRDAANQERKQDQEQEDQEQDTLNLAVGRAYFLQNDRPHIARHCVQDKSKRSRDEEELEACKKKEYNLTDRSMLAIDADADVSRIVDGPRVYCCESERSAASSSSEQASEASQPSPRQPSPRTTGEFVIKALLQTSKDSEASTRSLNDNKSSEATLTSTCNNKAKEQYVKVRTVRFGGVEHLIIKTRTQKPQQNYWSQEFPNRYLHGYTASVKDQCFDSFEAARSAANADPSSTGITKTSSGFQVRAGRALRFSPCGESSWIRNFKAKTR